MESQRLGTYVQVGQTLDLDGLVRDDPVLSRGLEWMVP